jgi:electron-transferring-flavoprotein dehydrogenase
MPQLTAPGVLICGDAGGMVNVPELKGIHYAMHAGILAAVHIVEALKGDSTDLRSYDYAVRDSLIGRDLYRTRNMRQPFGRGFFIGGAVANAMIATGGRLPGGHWKTHPDAEVEVFDGGHSAFYPKPDGRYTFDKLSSVFVSGNSTRDDAPDHIRIQRRVPRELAEMWQWMCRPACMRFPRALPPTARST